MKHVTSANEPVNPCSDESEGTHHVTFTSRPQPRFLPRLRKRSCEGRPGYEASSSPLLPVIKLTSWCLASESVTGIFKFLEKVQQANETHSYLSTTWLLSGPL